MRKRWILAVLACLVSAGLAAAQNPDLDWKPPAPISDAPPAPIDIPTLPGPQPPRYWGGAEFLRWQARTPVPIPIVTTGNPADGPLAGTLGRTDTRVLFGIDDVRFGYLPGLRVTLGAWLDPLHDFGVEHSFFHLPRQATVFNVGSDATGNPPIYLSGYNVVIRREDSGVIADPSQSFGGTVTVTNALQLWGGDTNILSALWRSPTIEIHCLAGFRFLHLQESMDVAAFSRDLGIDSRITSVDRFETTNNFFGGQVGFRARWQPSRLGFETTAKFALGANNQTVAISGEDTRFGSVFATTMRSPGGFFTQPSNIGTISQTGFAFVPSLDLKADFQCTQHLRVFFTYGFLVFNDVVRPGNQIDRNLNLSNNPVFGTGPRSNVPFPVPQFNHSAMFADGFSIGVELRF